MSTTNHSPHFKGLGQKMTNALEGSLQGVEAEIQELEQKSKWLREKSRPTTKSNWGTSAMLGGPAGEAHRPERRGESQCSSTFDLSTGHP